MWHDVSRKGLLSSVTPPLGSRALMCWVTKNQRPCGFQQQSLLGVMSPVASPLESV